VEADLSTAVSSGFRHVVWTAQGTTPAEIEAALRELLLEGQTQLSGYAPARAINMVCVVDKPSSGEVATRLRGAGRYLASRTIMCTVEPQRDRIDARAEISTDTPAGTGELALLREIVTVELGEEHLSRLEPIVDPLVVTDIATVLWSPSHYEEAVRALLPLSQVVLVDSVDASEPAEGLRKARELLESAYVVDLAWLRSTPWRERVAAAFDPPHLRASLGNVSAVTVRHREDSLAAAMLFCGWLSSRLGWKPGPMARSDVGMTGHARARKQEVRIRLEPMHQDAPGLAGVTLETASGEAVSLDRAPGGLKSVRRKRDGSEQTWTVLGASRGEGGILGEGVRQALLRDPTYRPALACARVLAQ
jgi:glucose-6-phosphate dehydrogenase assembly protein OpcA